MLRSTLSNFQMCAVDNDRYHAALCIPVSYLFYIWNTFGHLHLLPPPLPLATISLLFICQAVVFFPVISHINDIIWIWPLKFHFTNALKVHPSVTLLQRAGFHPFANG